MTTPAPVRAWTEKDGALLRLRLDAPRANLVDQAAGEAILAALDAHEADEHLLAVLIDHAGAHFSYGASIPEHMPDRMAGMLAGFHALIKRMVAYPLPILVAVKGYCLGGGLELAAAGHLIFAHPEAKLGQPEIKLAVFAPAGSCLLPERVGQGHANDLLFSGRTVTGEEAKQMGLVAATDPEPEAAALRYFETHLAGLSAPALRMAVRAASMGYAERIAEKLDAIERLYLDELMAHADPVEGLRAFMEKRAPVWRHR